MVKYSLIAQLFIKTEQVRICRHQCRHGDPLPQQCSLRVCRQFGGEALITALRRGADGIEVSGGKQIARLVHQTGRQRAEHGDGLTAVPSSKNADLIAHGAPKGRDLLLRVAEALLPKPVQRRILRRRELPVGRHCFSSAINFSNKMSGK